jgi:hypothetical protein
VASGCHHIDGSGAGGAPIQGQRSTRNILNCRDPRSMSQISWRTTIAHQSTEDTARGALCRSIEAQGLAVHPVIAERIR